MIGKVLVALVVWMLVVPTSAQGAERVTPIAVGKIFIDQSWGLDRVRFISGACEEDVLDGFAAAYMNVAAYRGETLRVTAVSTEYALEDLTRTPLSPSIVIAEGFECIPSSPINDRKPRGIAWGNEGVDVVVTGLYLQFTIAYKEHINERFRVELVEFT